MPRISIPRFEGIRSADSHYNAIWIADVLGRMIKNGVFMANDGRSLPGAGMAVWG